MSQFDLLLRLRQRLSRRILARPTYQTGSRKEGTLQTLALITGNISPSAQTVVDVGCNEATFARALAERGYSVAGIEGQAKYYETALQWVSSNGTPRITLLNKKLGLDDISSMGQVDVILLLSVHHQWVKHLGLETANRMLIQLAAKARQQFFFAPACIGAKYGADVSLFPDNDYDAIHKYFRALLEIPGERRLRFLGNTANLLPPSEPLRPLFVLEPENAGIGSFQLARDQEAISARSDIFEVSMKLCRLGLTQSPHVSGWSYLSASAREIIEGRAGAFEASVLLKYYQRWQPESWARILYHNAPCDVPILEKIPTRFYSPPLPWCDEFTWGLDDSMQFGFRLRPIPDGEFHFCGPMRKELAAAEFSRISNALDALVREGYEPEMHHDGYVRGYFLKLGEEVRFTVTGGQHRAGILGAMGKESFRAKFQPGKARCYDADHASSWPAVRSGLYTTEEAVRVVQRVFEQDGRPLAASLGLE